MLYDVIVVGSGAAGTFAAQELRGRNVLMLDVGNEPEAPPAGDDLTDNLYALKKSGADVFASLIGAGFESLHNVDREYLSPKLKAPLLRYVTQDWRRLFDADMEGFDPALSFAKGGLANAWGAGCYRYTDEELRDAGFGIRVADLEPYYERLTEHIGVTGAEDDLAPFFGSAQGCLPPLEMNRLGRELLGAYTQHQRHFNRRGFFMGAPRMGVLSRTHRERAEYDYNGLEFFKPLVPAVFNPAFTLDNMIEAGDLQYESGLLVTGYEDDGTRVEVTARHLQTNEEHRFHAKRLVLAAGALGSARIVLQAQRAHDARVPLLDNMISYVPLLCLRLIGTGVERRSLPVQLNLICQDTGQGPIQASVYGVSATLWNDFLFDFPLAFRDAMRALRYLMPAIALAQLFYPDRARPENYMRLGPDGRLVLHYEERERGRVEGKIIRAFARVGCLSAAPLCKYPTPGNSFHYAGTLPMRERPGPLETDASGRVSGHGNVFVADPATFSGLPSKNPTFTNMANAMRIAAGVRREVEGA
jgi:choline dehydrogenase-like flavoprotein